MARLPEKLRANIRQALEQSAEEITASMRRFAPTSKGPDSGTLRDSIGWTWGRPPKGAFVVGRVAQSAESGTGITIYAGSQKAFYARWQEFGTKRAPAHPFFFPAYRLHRRKVKGRIMRAVNKAIKETR